VPVDPSTECRVVGADGSEVPEGQPGELQLRGPSVLAGYLAPGGLLPAPVVEGWFGTGDLATLAPGGGFVYLARMGDALRLAGFLTDPAEIEQHLRSHPAVTGAQVVGVSTPAGREVSVAFVTGAADLDEALLVAHCRDGLANYKVPARIEMVDEFPTVDGANGVKVRKATLRDRASALVAGG
jgi:fatty-acyl-CoA synthase